MQRKVLLLTCAVFATSLFAQEPRAYLDGTILQMDSVQCIDKQANRPSQADAPEPSQTRRSAGCAEYVLQTDRVLYRIRPKIAQHEMFLPVGERAQFRLQQDELLLRVRALDSEEREYMILSMASRVESAADSRRLRPNHLQ
jgi:hypothetical protein